MRRRIAIATAGTAAALALGSAAGAAEAPIVSAQDSRAGRAPVTIPGTGVSKGEKLPRGARIVSRRVTLEGDQSVTFRLRAPRGRTLRGLGMAEKSQVAFAVVEPRNYPGGREVTVRATVRPGAGGEVSDRIYALVR